MGSVVFLALALGMHRLWAVRRECLEHAADHALEARMLNGPENIKYWEQRLADASYPEKPPSRLPRWIPLKIAYHARMRLKWERGARYPWLPVEPDPPFQVDSPPPKRTNPHGNPAPNRHVLVQSRGAF
jgi:hypothetical protein